MTTIRQLVLNLDLKFYPLIIDKQNYKFGIQQAKKVLNQLLEVIIGDQYVVYQFTMQQIGIHLKVCKNGKRKLNKVQMKKQQQCQLEIKLIQLKKELLLLKRVKNMLIKIIFILWKLLQRPPIIQIKFFKKLLKKYQKKLMIKQLIRKMK